MPKILHPRGRLATALRRHESAEIMAAIAESHGDIPAAARLLGVSRRSLYRRIDDLEIRVAAGLEPGQEAASC
jgi:transcriptional regulator of acetoin/glycerol metabolism